MRPLVGVHVGEQLHERALAGAVLADERDHRARGELDVHVGERLVVGAGIRERDVLQADRVGDAVGDRHLGGAGLARRVVLEPREPA